MLPKPIRTYQNHHMDSIRDRCQPQVGDIVISASTQTTKIMIHLLLVIGVLLFSTASAYAQSNTTLYLPTVIAGQAAQSSPQAGELIADQYIVVLRADLVTA